MSKAQLWEGARVNTPDGPGVVRKLWTERGVLLGKGWWQAHVSVELDEGRGGGVWIRIYRPHDVEREDEKS